MVRDRRNHITLVQRDHWTRTSRIPSDAWEAWVFLRDEASFYGHQRRVERLDLWLGTSASVEGWGAGLLVDAMKGEQMPPDMPAAAFLGAGELEPEQEEPKKRRGLLGRLLR